MSALLDGWVDNKRKEWSIYLSARQQLLHEESLCMSGLVFCETLCSKGSFSFFPYDGGSISYRLRSNIPIQDQSQTSPFPLNLRRLSVYRERLEDQIAILDK